MNSKQHKQSENFFRQAVILALIEQGNIDPAPLKAFLINILESTTQSDDEKIGWLKGETTLMAFFNLLYKHGFVTCECEFFKTHFEGINHPQTKIIWNANLNELVYLFWRLREEEIIPLHKNPHVLLQENFLDKYEKPLNTGSLRTLLDKGINDSKRKEMIEKIIDEVLYSRKTGLQKIKLE